MSVHSTPLRTLLPWPQTPLKDDNTMGGPPCFSHTVEPSHNQQNDPAAEVISLLLEADPFAFRNYRVNFDVQPDITTALANTTIHLTSKANGQLFYEGGVPNKVKKCFGTIHYKCGEIYSGEHLCYVPHGYGKHTFRCGYSYVGKFQNGAVINDKKGFLIDSANTIIPHVFGSEHFFLMLSLFQKMGR